MMPHWVTGQRANSGGVGGTALTHGIFLHTNAAQWVFSQFVNALCKLLRWLCQCGNPSRSAICEIVKLTHHLNPLSSTIIRLSHFELQKVTFNTCSCLMVLYSCHAIDWLATDGNKQLKFLTDKVAGRKTSPGHQKDLTEWATQIFSRMWTTSTVLLH